MYNYKSVYAKFDEEKVITVGNDRSLAIWDQAQRDSFKNPLFLKRIEIENKVLFKSYPLKIKHFILHNLNFSLIGLKLPSMVKYT